MAIVPDQSGQLSVELSLKAATATNPNSTSAYAVEGLDWVRVQAVETSAASWDSATLKLQWSLDSVDWFDSGTTLSADGLSAKVDIMAIGFVRLIKGTDATSATPIVRCVIFGEVEN